MKTGSFAAPRRTRRHSLYRPQLESIETRLLLSNVYTVRNTSNAGPGSLRTAITQANLNPGSTIDFDITLNAIDEFPVTTRNSHPQGITAGPDGNLWFTETQVNQIGRITPDGVVTEFGDLTPGSAPQDITAGPDGNLWFTESSANQIGRITPIGSVTEYALPNIGGSDTIHVPFGITLGPDHNLWFTDDAFILVSGLSVPSNAIGMITPAGNVTEYPIPTANGSPEFITTGPDGNLYFTENQGHAIGQITPSGAITEFPIANPNIAPVGITTGPDGALWFTFDESGTPGGIGRMTTSGAFTFYPLSTSNSSPEAITAGPDGFLYFTESGTSQIGRISTSGTITEFPIPTRSSAPFGIALGPDHNLWFTEQSANQIGRLVPNANSTYTIQPLSTLPTITASVTIDATTQPGFAGKPIVELDGALAGNSNGLNIAASNTTVKGLVINRFAGQGIVVFPLVPSAPVSNVVIQGNYIGTDLTGTVALPNHDSGVVALTGVSEIQILDNLISGNGQNGVIIQGGNGGLIAGNLVGTDATGTRALGNQNQGVLIQGDDNVVGGPSPAQCLACSTDNVIAGNGGAGVEIGPTSGGAGNVVQNNLIGLSALSSGPTLGNGGDGIFIHGTATNTAIVGNTVANNAGNGVDIQGTTGQVLSTTVASNSIRANALYGVQIFGATGNVIGGSTIAAGNTISENRLGGIALLDTSNDQVLGNFIGTDSSGLQALGNGGPGVLIDASSHTIAIGGTSSPYAGNVIAANAGGGILLFGTANTVQGNRIGTDISGSKTVDSQGRSLGNPFGVAIAQQDGQGGFGNLIGGTEAGAPNIIAGSPGNASASGATGSGIALLPGTHDNAIQGNFIVANQDGILAFDSSTNLIGGVGAGVANTIAFNANNGVSVQGSSLDDLILSNAIYANSGLGIAVAPTANGGIAPPALTAAVNFSGLTTIQGTYAGTPGTSYLLQFFANPPSDPSEGRVLIGSATVSTDSAGMASFSVAFPVGTSIFITATASRGGVGTSQFSTPVFVSPLPFTVVNTNDSGPGSLRQAILNSNLHPGVDTINFLIPGPGPYVIDLLSPVVVTDPAIIDGYTQPGARPNTLTNGDNAVIPVVVDGSQAGQVGAGMIIEAGDTLVRGLVFQNFTGAGLALAGKGGDTVSGCFIGTDWTGTQAAGNGAAGLLVGEFPSSASASAAAPPAGGNVIGGASPADRDIISGNGGPGIYLFGGTTGNLIAGNLIGTDASGTRSLGNVTAGIIIGASDGPTAQNQIGGTTPDARNIISGNNGPGVYLFGGTTGNLIMGNFIGTDTTGLIAVGNANIGVLITDSPNNVVGGLAPGAGNVISGNRAASPPSPPSANPNTTGAGGVVILGNASTGNQVLGNFIGTDVTGTAPLGNGYDGVGISGAPNNVVGGPAPGARNVIAGNGGVGVRIAGSNASGNVVQGNFIGTDVTGTAALGNAFDGVYIDAAPNNTIGGTTPDAGNVISANHYSGIEIAALGATGNVVQGNLIGTSANGAESLGNSGYGVLIQNTTGNTIGPGNVIVNNGLGGFQVLLGGLPPTTTAGVGNTNTGNTFANNGAGRAGTTARPRFRLQNFHQVPRSGAWGRRPAIHTSLSTHPVAMVVHARFAPASDPLQASAVDAVFEAGAIDLDHRPRKPSSIIAR